jgi:hypothetical protein
VSPCPALWTTLSGFESLPPSHFLALLVVAARQRVLWSCRGAPAARRAKTESLPPSQYKSFQYNNFAFSVFSRPPGPETQLRHGCQELAA